MTLLDFLNYINVWWPWFSFFSEILFLQLFIIYSFYMLVTTYNLYYALIYVFLQIIFFGLFLSLYQLELFTAFLWLTEVVVILVALFLLFNTNPSGNVSKILINKNSIRIFGIPFISIFLSLNYTFYVLSESHINNFLLTTMFWENYYEALNNENYNDVYGLFLSYYWLNSFEFILIGVFLLLGSLVCVHLNQFLKTNKTLSYVSFFDIFDYFKEITNVLFLRKQNLVDQENAASSTRSFKKKKSDRETIRKNQKK